MPFGNLLSEAAVIATGTYGSIYTFDLSPVYARKVEQVVLADGLTFYPAVTTPVTMKTLFDYIADSSAPDIAFCFEGNTLYLFVNSDHATSCRIGIEYIRNFIKPPNTSTYFDIPEQCRELALNLLDQKMIESKGNRIGFDIQQKIIREKASLGL